MVSAWWPQLFSPAPVSRQPCQTCTRCTVQCRCSTGGWWCAGAQPGRQGAGGLHLPHSPGGGGGGLTAWGARHGYCRHRTGGNTVHCTVISPLALCWKLRCHWPLRSYWPIRLQLTSFGEKMLSLIPLVLTPVAGPHGPGTWTGRLQGGITAWTGYAVPGGAVPGEPGLAGES